MGLRSDPCDTPRFTRCASEKEFYILTWFMWSSNIYREGVSILCQSLSWWMKKKKALVCLSFVPKLFCEDILLQIENWDNFHITRSILKFLEIETLNTSIISSLSLFFCWNYILPLFYLNIFLTNIEKLNLNHKGGKIDQFHQNIQLLLCKMTRSAAEPIIFKMFHHTTL